MTNQMDLYVWSIHMASAHSLRVVRWSILQEPHGSSDFFPQMLWSSWYSKNPTSHAIVSLHIQIRPFTITFPRLVWPKHSEQPQMVLSPHSNSTRLSHQVPLVITGNANCKWNLLAAADYSRVSLLPIWSCHTICNCWSTILNIAYQ